MLNSSKETVSSPFPLSGEGQESSQGEPANNSSRPEQFGHWAPEFRKQSTGHASDEKRKLMVRGEDRKVGKKFMYEGKFRQPTEKVSLLQKCNIFLYVCTPSVAKEVEKTQCR